MRRRGRNKAGARHVEERPRKDDPIRVHRRPHGGQTEHAGTALEAQHQCLGKIVAMMGGEEMAGAERPRRIDKQPVARGTRFRLDVGGRRPSRAHEDARREAACLGRRHHIFGLAPRAAAQAMIDGEHDDVGAPAAAFAPARRGNHQGE